MPSDIAMRWVSPTETWRLSPDILIFLKFFYVSSPKTCCTPPQTQVPLSRSPISGWQRLSATLWWPLPAERQDMLVNYYFNLFLIIFDNFLKNENVINFNKIKLLRSFPARGMISRSIIGVSEWFSTFCTDFSFFLLKNKKINKKTKKIN